MAVNFYAAIPLMAVLAIIQTAILPRFPIAGVEPQLLFLVALAWGLLRGLDEGLVWAFIAGIWVDLFSLTPVGLSSLAFMAGVAAPILLQPMLPPRRLPVTALLAALGTLIYLLLYVIALGLLGHGLSAVGLAGLLPIVLLHAILVLPIYYVVHQLLRVLQPRRVEF
ncbi:MAG: rod shape-determining protein MreD [Candidatus Promineofilum sp.]|nr:rod shape-determining protein MreD [Promineifilum sp.]